MVGESFREYCNNKSRKNVESEHLVSTRVKVQPSLEFVCKHNHKD